MEDKRATQKVHKSTMERVNNLDFAKRGVSFNDVVNRLIDEYESKKKKK